MSDTFTTMTQSDLGDRFLRDGYVIVPAEDPAALEKIRAAVAALACRHLGLEIPQDTDAFLNAIDDHVDVVALNDFRVAIIEGINRESWFRPTYLSLARRALENIVGNELAMQRRINLSIQIPNDASSLLPVHADVWAGDSPFEVVLWVPLVDCARTKSMFMVPPAFDRAVQARFKDFSGQKVEDLYQAIKDEAHFLEVPYGHVVLFSQTLMHGNRVNEEPETRWTMNCRFKSVFSPYADKKLGEFFEPITLRPNTRFAMAYRLPDGFDD